MSHINWDEFFANNPHPTTGDRWERATVIDADRVIIRTPEQNMGEGTVITLEKLCRILSWIGSHGSCAKRFPADYPLSWNRFVDAVEERGGYTLEADLFECITNPVNLFWLKDEFVDLFLKDGSAKPAVTPAADLLDSFGFPAVTADAIDRGLERPVPEGVALWVRGWSGTRSPWLWLMGGTGAGKTCSAAWACVEVAQAAQRSWRPLPSIRFLHASALVDLVDGSSLYGTDTFANLALPYIDADLLVLDDLGVEPRKSRYFDAYARIIGGRSDAMRSTICTTQYGLRGWLTMLGASTDEHARSRLASRIMFALGGYKREPNAQRERILAGVVRFDGEDLRNPTGEVA